MMVPFTVSGEARLWRIAKLGEPCNKGLSSSRICCYKIEVSEAKFAVSNTRDVPHLRRPTANMLKRTGNLATK